MNKLALIAGAVTLAGSMALAEDTTMHAQIITYELKDVDQAFYLENMVNPDAVFLAEYPGLLSKVWLADEATNTYGGFYMWESKAAMDAFMVSDLVAAVVSRPYVTNVKSVDWSVNSDASRVTHAIN